MQHSSIMLAIAALLLCTGLAGCAPIDAQPRQCALLANAGFCCGIDDCSRRRHEPLSTGQLIEFVGEPDLSAPWATIKKTLAAQPGMDRPSCANEMARMRKAYAFGKDIDTETPPMDGVEVWLYMWNKPDPLFVSGLISRPAGAVSIAVLVENGRVVGICSIHRSVNR